MTPNQRKIHRAFVILLVLLTGCTQTKPPPAGLDEAARELEAARNAGAATYAPLELRNAEERLSQARARMDKRDYATAQQFSEESRTDSDLAAAKARLGKAREKVEARTRENAQLRQDLSGSSTAPEGTQP
jgi:predicted  nucleic acid-binding Zn-ribbon protein